MEKPIKTNTTGNTSIKTFSTCVIEENALMRAGIKSLLNNSHFEVSMEAADIKDIEENSCDLVVSGIDQSPEKLTEVLTVLKSKASHSHIVILSSHLERDLLTASFSSGADGFLLKSISSEALIASLDLVMSGEKVFPTPMASVITSGDWKEDDDGHQESDAHLSPRALDIIYYVAEGCSNKLIARKLDITEATVKVHMKAILRKLHLENRTQVAIWAVSNGVTPNTSAYSLPHPAAGHILLPAQPSRDSKRAADLR